MKIRTILLWIFLAAAIGLFIYLVRHHVFVAKNIITPASGSAITAQN